MANRKIGWFKNEFINQEYNLDWIYDRNLSKRRFCKLFFKSNFWSGILFQGKVLKMIDSFSGNSNFMKITSRIQNGDLKVKVAWKIRVIESFI